MGTGIGTGTDADRGTRYIYNTHIYIYIIDTRTNSDRQKKLGVVSCRICAAKYQMECHYLHAPIDVYSEWIDACEDVNNSSKPSASQPGRGGAAERKNAELGLGLGDDDLSDDDF